MQHHRAGAVREPLRFAAAGGHQVDLHLAVVIAIREECKVAAVGGPSRLEVGPRASRQPPRRAALGVHDPDVRLGVDGVRDVVV